MGVMEAHRLLNKVVLEALIRLRLQCRGVLEHPRHIAALGEELLTVILRRLRQGEVFPVDLDGRLALVAVGGHAFEVDNVVAGQQFAVAQTIDHLVVHRQDGLTLIGLEFLEAYRTKEMIAIKVIPVVATPDNCEKVKNVSKDFLNVTAKWMEDLKKSK